MSQTYRIGSLNFTGSQAILSASLDVSGSGRFTDGLTVTGSLIAPNITGSLQGTASFATSASWAPNSLTSSYPILASGNSIYSFNSQNDGNLDNVYLGKEACSGSVSSANTIAIGREAGHQYGGGDQAILIGGEAGKFAGYLNTVVAIGGWRTAHSSSAIDSTIALGREAAAESINTRYSVFIGERMGLQVRNDFAFYDGYNTAVGSYAASYTKNILKSNFIGVDAGQGSENIISSNFIGNYVGHSAVSASYSTLIGYHVGKNTTTSSISSIGSNNIIIGTSITLPAGRKDSINLGGIIFATGSYFDDSFSPAPFSGSAGGRVGINVVNPQYNFEVSGSGNYTNGLTVTGSFTVHTGSTEFQVLPTGTKIGNNSSDLHTVTGSLSIQSGSGDLFVHGNKQFNYGVFQNNYTLSGSANVSYSFHFNTTDEASGVSITNNGSGQPTQITFANDGVYDIQFSTQLAQGSGTANVYIWFKKDGVNIPESATRLTVPGNSYAVPAWNFMKTFNSGSYAEIAWQSDSTNTTFVYEAATGNIPIVPAIIVTVNQVR